MSVSRASLFWRVHRDTLCYANTGRFLLKNHQPNICLNINCDLSLKLNTKQELNLKFLTLFKPEPENIKSCSR